MFDHYGIRIISSDDDSGGPSIVSFKGGGGGRGGSRGGSGLDSNITREQIPGIVYAAWYGFLLLCALSSLATAARRSYITAFMVAICCFGVVHNALSAVPVWQLVSYSLGMAKSVFFHLRVGCIMATLVAVGAESARASAYNVLKPQLGRKIIGISTVGHVLAAIYVAMFGVVQKNPVALVSTGPISSTIIIYPASLKAGQWVQASASIICVVLSLSLWGWGISLGGTSRRHKWLVPILALFFLIYWTCFVSAVAVTKSGNYMAIIENPLNSALVWWTWGMVPLALFSTFLVFAWAPTDARAWRNPSMDLGDDPKPTITTTPATSLSFQQTGTYQAPKFQQPRNSQRTPRTQIDPSAEVWVQPPGHAGYWTTYGALPPREQTGATVSI